MWITARCPTLFPATVTAILGRVSRLYREPKPDSLAHLDDHLLRDIGLSRTDVNDMISGRSRKVTKTHE